ncbi:hypothetical protein EP331_06205 [bacterium]|nr:MAG: hypothetical protein EP331_06205 [bacterium]
MDKKSKSRVIQLLIALILIMVFHGSILFGLIPFEYTWGGRLKSIEEMYVFESVSIAVNLYLGLILLIRGAYAKPIISLKFVKVSLWIFAGLFLLNTFGNVLAETWQEQLFAGVTLWMSFLTWRLAAKQD